MPSITSNLTTFTNVDASTMNNGGQAGWYWANPSNAQLNDNSYSIFGWYGGNPQPIGAEGQSDVLDCRQLVSTIPSGATINGFEVVFRCFNGLSLSYQVSDAFVHLLKAGSVIMHPLPVTSYIWSASEAVQTYGGPTDLWGTTWSAADVNGAGFGVSLAVNTIVDPFAEAITTPSQSTMDQVYVTVYYTVGGVAATAQTAIGAIIGSAQVIGAHRVYSTVTVRPSSVITRQNSGFNTLIGSTSKVFPSSIITRQNTGANSLIGGTSKVFPSSIFTRQNAGVN